MTILDTITLPAIPHTWIDREALATQVTYHRGASEWGHGHRSRNWLDLADLAHALAVLDARIDASRTADQHLTELTYDTPADVVDRAADIAESAESAERDATREVEELISEVVRNAFIAAAEVARSEATEVALTDIADLDIPGADSLTADTLDDWLASLTDSQISGIHGSDGSTRSWSIHDRHVVGWAAAYTPALVDHSTWWVSVTPATQTVEVH